MGVDFGAQRGSEPWDLDVDDAEEMADCKEVHAPGGSLGEAAAARAGKDTPKSPPPKKTRTVEPPEMAQGAAQPVSTCENEPPRHIFSLWRSAHVQSSQRWQVHENLYVAPVYYSAGMHQHAPHWPACYDQTCGYPGEGPKTTPDSLDAL